MPNISIVTRFTRKTTLGEINTTTRDTVNVLKCTYNLYEINVTRTIRPKMTRHFICAYISIKSLIHFKRLNTDPTIKSYNRF